LIFFARQIRQEHSGILLILELAFINSAALPSASHNKLDSQLAKHVRQARPGCAIAMLLEGAAGRRMSLDSAVRDEAACRNNNNAANRSWIVFSSAV
jgi:hypothetical protein